MLLGLDRLFRDDEADGTLLLFRHAAIPLEAIVFGKMIAHWLLTALPLLVASPLLAVLLAMDPAGWSRTALSLLLGTPALAAFGDHRRGGDGVAAPRRTAAPVLILPLSIPVLIFGVAPSPAAPAAPPRCCSLPRSASSAWRFARLPPRWR